MINKDYKLVLTYINKKGKPICKAYPAILDDKLIEKFLELDQNSYERNISFDYEGWTKEEIIDHITSYGICEQRGLWLEVIPTNEVDEFIINQKNWFADYV